ncbi:hypothetical protein D3C87_1391080 [compost metagenome]
MEFELGRVEGPLALRDLEIIARGAQCVAQGLLGRIPTLDRAAELFRPRGELDDDILKAHVPIDRIEQMHEMLGFGLDLVLTAENMRIVLRHLPHAHQPMQRAVSLVAVTATEFRHAQREIAVGLDALIEDLHMCRTVHRLEGQKVADLLEHRLVILGIRHLVRHHEHVLAILAPVS